MGSGRLAGVGPDRVGPGGGARGRGGRPGRMAGERGLPDAHDQRSEDREDCDELDRRLPGLGARTSVAAARADLWSGVAWTWLGAGASCAAARAGLWSGIAWTWLGAGCGHAETLPRVVLRGYASVLSLCAERAPDPVRGAVTSM